MNNDDVAQRWASGKAGRSGNMSTNGTTLLSYSTTIGHRHEVGGRTLFLLSSTQTSTTTKTKHLPPANRAARYDAIDVPEPSAVTEEQHRTNVADLLRRAANHDGKAKRATKYEEGYRETARRLRREACRYVTFFAGEPDATTMPAPILADWLEERNWTELAHVIRNTTEE